MKRITALIYFSLFALGLSLPTFQSLDGELQGRADSPSYFAEYHECDPKQVEKINWAYEDAMKLVDIPAQLNLAVQDSFSWCGAGICAAGTLEKRFFGEDIDFRPEAYQLIQTVFMNIRDLQYKESKIRVSCVDVETPKGNTAIEVQTCATAKDLGAYTFGTSKRHSDNTIVFCPLFFDAKQFKLSERERNLADSPDERTDPHRMLTRGQIMVHELAHAPAITETDRVIITDKKWDPINKLGNMIYGINIVEKFTRKWPSHAYLNADNYAWYATEKYFEKFYGPARATLSPRYDPSEDNTGNDDDTSGKEEEKPTKSLNIILENRRHGIPMDEDFYDQTKYKFFMTTYGDDSVCKNDPPAIREEWAQGIYRVQDAAYLGGTYDVKTPDGDCQYKNDGKGNAGALWCGGDGHICRAHDDMTQGSGAGNHYCDPEEDKTVQVQQHGIAICEW